MKATAKLLATALVASCAILVANDVHARADAGKHRSGAHRGGDGHRYGGHRYSGHRYSGHRGHWYGDRYWRGNWGWGLSIGVPLYWGAGWGWPHYYDYGYPRETVVYREVERMPESYPEGRLGPAPTTEVPLGEGAPARGPLYMNYCESAKAYFPKVTRCPEGWRLTTPSS